MNPESVIRQTSLQLRHLSCVPLKNTRSPISLTSNNFVKIYKKDDLLYMEHSIHPNKNIVVRLTQNGNTLHESIFNSPEGEIDHQIMDLGGFYMRNYDDDDEKLDFIEKSIDIFLRYNKDKSMTSSPSWGEYVKQMDTFCTTDFFPLLIKNRNSEKVIRLKDSISEILPIFKSRNPRLAATYELIGLLLVKKLDSSLIKTVDYFFENCGQFTKFKVFEAIVYFEKNQNFFKTKHCGTLLRLFRDPLNVHEKMLLKEMVNLQNLAEQKKLDDKLEFIKEAIDTFSQFGKIAEEFSMWGEYEEEFENVCVKDFFPCLLQNRANELVGKYSGYYATAVSHVRDSKAGNIIVFDIINQALFVDRKSSIADVIKSFLESEKVNREDAKNAELYVEKHPSLFGCAAISEFKDYYNSCESQDNDE